MMLQELLSSIYDDKLVYDNREPCYIFELPGLGTYGVMAPVITIWLQLLIDTIAVTMLVAGFSILVYEFILKRRGTSTSYLFGWGVMIPFCVLAPRACLDFLDIRNGFLAFLVGGMLPVLFFFRCIETMYGFNPEWATKSVGNFVLHMVSCQEIDVIDKKTDKERPMKAEVREVLPHLKEFFFYLILIGIYESWLSAYDHRPFDNEFNNFDQGLWWMILSPRQLLNNFCMGIMFLLTLLLCSNALSALTVIFLGVQVIPNMNNPLLSSSSVRMQYISLYG